MNIEGCYGLSSYPRRLESLLLSYLKTLSVSRACVFDPALPHSSPMLNQLRGRGERGEEAGGTSLWYHFSLTPNLFGSGLSSCINNKGLLFA